MDLLDITLRGESLAGQFISGLVLQILSYVAETKRLKIQARVKSGLENAKAKGVKLGRPATETPKGFEEVYEEYKSKEITVIEAMRELDMKKTMFYKLVKQHR